MLSRNNSSTTKAESETNLLDPGGPLSKVTPSSTIANVNGKVSSVIEEPVAVNRGLYLSSNCSPEVPGRREPLNLVLPIPFGTIRRIFPVFH